MIVKEPPSSILRAAPKKRFGGYNATGSIPPDNVLPLASVIVPETKIGNFESFSSSRVLTAYNAALQLSVSKTVSIKNKSAPPSNQPLACS